MLIEIDDDRVKKILELHTEADELIDGDEFDKAKKAFNQMRNMATNAVLTGIAIANKEQGNGEK